MKPIRARNPVVVGVAGLAILIVIALLAFNADNLPIIGGGTTYHADFTEAAGLQPGNEVRIAGVRVGKVTSVELDGAQVRVAFRIKHAWVGDASTVSIQIKTLLGAKYLSLDPLGTADQPPSRTIPASRTASPYDVTQAFNTLANTVGQIDTAKVATSLEVIATTFANTPPTIKRSITGLSALSATISSRDTQLTNLLASAQRVTGQVAAEDNTFQTLLGDGNQLLSELRRRKSSITALLTGTQQLATQLSGLVNDNTPELSRMLNALNQVTSTLQNNQQNLAKALSLMGPYYRLLGNTLGNGRWFDSYLCGVIPKDYLPPNTPPATGCMPPKAGGAR